MQPFWRGGVALFAVSVLVLLGCGGGKSASNERVRIALVGSGSAEYPMNARRGAEKAAAEFDADVEFHVPKNGTAAEQQSIVDGLLAKGLRAIAISPIDAAEQAEFLDGVAERVQLITQDSDAPQGGKRACYVGADNYEAGRTAGQLVKEAMPEGGRVVILADQTDIQIALDRRQGLRDELIGQADTSSKSDRYELVDARTKEGPPNECQAVVNDALAKHGSQLEHLCLVCIGSCKTPAVLSAVKDAHLEGQVRLVGFDEKEETLQAIKNGVVYGTIVQRPFDVGYQTVKILSNLARGDRSYLPETGVKFLDSQVITADNVDDYLAAQRESTK